VDSIFKNILLNDMGISQEEINLGIRFSAPPIYLESVCRLVAIRRRNQAIETLRPSWAAGLHPDCMRPECARETSQYVAVYSINYVDQPGNKEM
jgi:hypothetical protein